MVWSQIRQKSVVLIEDDFDAVMEEFRHNGTECDICAAMPTHPGPAESSVMMSPHHDMNLVDLPVAAPPPHLNQTLETATMLGASCSSECRYGGVQQQQQCSGGGGEEETLLSSSQTVRRARYRRNHGEVCVFCKNNGETSSFFTSHLLKDQRGIIQCPVLRAYTCPTCGVNGDFAHTIKYCPLRRAARTRRRVVIL